MKHCIWAVLAAVVALPALADSSLHYYWPRFPRPETVLTVKEMPSRETAIMVETLSGMLVRAAVEGKNKTMIWTPNGHPSYQRWFRMMLEQTGARETGPFEPWALVKQFKDLGLIKGYILYKYDASERALFQPGEMDTSVNSATALCPLLGGIAVSEGLEQAAKDAGLPMLLDARTLTEERCYEQYKGQLSNYIVALQEPKVNEIRSEAIALGAMVFSRPHDTYRRALSALQHDTPVLGWGVGDEMEITKPATVYGHFITATNWCHNLPLLSTEKIGETLPADRLRQPRQNGIWDLAWESDVHYAAFIMSDGDNVQWLMGDFVEDAWHCYWSNANRGKVPIGWTNCYMELAQLCPYAIEHLFKTATPNDDFVLFGGGYYYPDLFGSETGEQRLLRSHARRVGQYMQLANMRLFAVNCADWDSDAALGAYETFAQEIPTLDAIFAIQYAPYTAGEGAIKWVKTKEFEDVPVISARYSIWANVKSARDASPTVIAAKLNGMPHNGGPDTEDRFSWVVAHAWSWFKEPKQGEAPGAEEIDQAQGGQPGTGRGLNAVKWCVDALQPHVRVVTPGVLANLIQLRLHPQDTLTDELQGLERRLAKLREAQQKPAEDHMAQADELLKNAFKSLQKTLYQESFELGKQVYQILTQAG